MFPRILMAFLLLLFVHQPQMDPQDCKAIESELASCNKRLGGANAECEKRLADQKKQLYEKVVHALQGELTRAQNSLKASESQYAQLKTEYGQLNSKFVESERTVAALREQNGQQKASYEKQLADRQASIDAQTKDLGDKNREITRLNAANVSLAAEMSKLDLCRKSAEQARAAAEQAKTELKQSLDLLTDEQRKRPETLLKLVKDYQNKMDQNGPASITQGKDGGLTRELVIGTLEVKPYPAEVPADGKLQLIATFTPHPLAGVFDSNSHWYVKLVYNPPPGINAPYNQKESLGEEDREVHMGVGHQWVWIVDAPKDSQAVLTATQMNILAGFEKDKVDLIASQPVILTRGKPAPGFFAMVFGLLKENLTYILMTITALCGIWAGILTVKIKKFELGKSEKENLAKGEQPASPPPT
jgi:hypothetical protein